MPDHLGMEKTNVGWSDEAIIALDLAIHHPERLDRVVACEAIFTLPSDANTPFERQITDYRRLAPEPGRFEEMSEVLCCDVLLVLARRLRSQFVL